MMILFPANVLFPGLGERHAEISRGQPTLEHCWHHLEYFSILIWLICFLCLLFEIHALNFNVVLCVFLCVLCFFRLCFLFSRDLCSYGRFLLPWWLKYCWQLLSLTAGSCSSLKMLTLPIRRAADSRQDFFCWLCLWKAAGRGITVSKFTRNTPIRG
jgi:hypothetical protein